MRSREDFERALDLLAAGHTPTATGRLLDLPRSTVRDWSHGRYLSVHRSGGSFDCDHRADLDPAAYGYLLGMYLGDGCLDEGRRGVWRLRVSLDGIYPGIIQDCSSAMSTVAGGNSVGVFRKHKGRGVDVVTYWKHWPCVFPQHGPGPKHLRPIVLCEWQREIVMADPRDFLRGLIHSDGTRIVATERKGSYVRRAPRYAFSNRSEDILQLFGQACTALGVWFTRASAKQIAIYRKDSVAKLDAFIGPKR